ncbi:MAG: proline reductase cluster protein PrdD [Fusobacteriaceae bacterium]
MNIDALSIKVFHVKKVLFGDKISLNNKELIIATKEKYMDILDKNKELKKYIKNIKISIIKPERKNIYVNSIMDFIPISTKVLGKIGSGITHTLTGVVVMLTGCDEKKNQICEFGKSDGILDEQVKFSQAGTPEINDYIIHIDFEVYEKTQALRECINSCHEFSDIILQEIRIVLKKKDGNEADERHDYQENKEKLRKKIVIMKQVAGQGAMSDTRVFPEEPSGYLGGNSVIDFMNMPILISPNEYRDGAIRAMH